MGKQFTLTEMIKECEDDGVLYNQKESQDVIAYTAAIDREYERLYFKMKDKV